jgi:hypothetical protein
MGWQDVASLLVGVWLVGSPLVLGFAGAAFWLSIALGLGVLLFAVEAFGQDVLSSSILHSFRFPCDNTFR